MFEDLDLNLMAFLFAKSMLLCFQNFPKNLQNFLKVFDEFEFFFGKFGNFLENFEKIFPKIGPVTVYKIWFTCTFGFRIVQKNVKNLEN